MSGAYHGVFIVEKAAGGRPVRVARQSLAVLFGTAPNADADAFPLNKPVMVVGSMRGKIDTVGDGAGTLPDAMRAIFDQHDSAIFVVIRVEANADPATQNLNLIGGTDANGVKTGFDAIRDVKTLFGIRPELVAAPGFTHDQAVLAALTAKAESYKLLAFGDCAGSTYAEAVAYKQNFGSRNLELVWPPVINTKSREVPLSAYRLGLEIAKDANPAEGYSGSASNMVINGIIEATILVDFEEGEKLCLANLLNGNRINTVINDGDGLTFWGNYNTSPDPQWKFSQQVRIFYKLNTALPVALKYAKDKKISRSNFSDSVVKTVSNMFQNEVNVGHLYGYECWPNAELNTPDNIMAGNFYLDCRYTGVAIAEAITVTLEATNDYATI